MNKPDGQMTNPSNWVRKLFKNNKVWMAVGPGGGVLEKEGKVLIKYQLNQDYEYWVHANSLRDLDENPQGGGDSPHLSLETPKRKKTDKKPSVPPEATAPENAILVFTDGASSGNPGPGGIGVVLKYGDLYKEISRPLGETTNNIAELEAIRTGLSAIKHPDRPVRVYTDSSYALGVLSLGWKPKKNIELIQSIQDLAKAFKDLKFIKVKGHSGHPENETADRLATSAIRAVMSEQ